MAVTGWVHVKVVDAAGRVTARRLVHDRPVGDQTGGPVRAVRLLACGGATLAQADLDDGYPVEADTTWQGHTVTFQATFGPDAAVCASISGAALLTDHDVQRSRAAFTAMAKSATDTLVARWQLHHQHDHEGGAA